MKRENKLKLSGYELKINAAKLFLYPCLLLPSKSFFFSPFCFSLFGNARDQLASILHIKTIRSGGVAGSQSKTCCWIPSASPQVISVTECQEKAQTSSLRLQCQIANWRDNEGFCRNMLISQEWKEAQNYVLEPQTKNESNSYSTAFVPALLLSWQSTVCRW